LLKYTYAINASQLINENGKPLPPYSPTIPISQDPNLADRVDNLGFSIPNIEKKNKILGKLNIEISSYFMAVATGLGFNPIEDDLTKQDNTYYNKKWSEAIKNDVYSFIYIVSESTNMIDNIINNSKSYEKTKQIFDEQNQIINQNDINDGQKMFDEKIQTQNTDNINLNHEVRPLINDYIKVHEYVGAKLLEFLKIEGLDKQTKTLRYDDISKQDDKIYINLFDHDDFPGLKILNIASNQDRTDYEGFFIIDEKAKEVYLSDFTVKYEDDEVAVTKNMTDREKYTQMTFWFSEQIDDELYVIQGTKNQLFSTLEKDYLNEELINKTQFKSDSNELADQSEKNYLLIPYSDRAKAGKLGAQWDSEAKLWFVPKELDLNNFKKWLPVTPPVKGKCTPEQEFKSCLVENGFKFDNSLEPVLDGHVHRVPLEGSKNGAVEGAYKGILHEGNRPRGWFQNLRTGEKVPWVFTGAKLTQKEISEMRERAKEKFYELKALKDLKTKEAIERAQKKFADNEKNNASDLTSHPYLDSKGLIAPRGVRYEETENGVNLLVPLKRVYDSGVVNILTIKADGTQSFEENCPKEKCMFLIRSEEGIREKYDQYKNPVGPALDRPALLFTSDFASAVMLNKCTKRDVVCTFEDCNLESVSREYSHAFCEAKFIFCANNDHWVPNNPGVTFAQDAADMFKELQSESENFDNHPSIFIPKFPDPEKAKDKSTFCDLALEIGEEKLSESLNKPIQYAVDGFAAKVEIGLIGKDSRQESDLTYFEKSRER
jgi:phage/plasmid primase-like uncharacterized protein